jgi:hypothetical protein
LKLPSAVKQSGGTNDDCATAGGDDMKRIMIAVLLLNIAGAWSADKDGKFTMRGTTSCGTYVEAQKSGNGKHELTVWLWGFFTAYNWRTLDTVDILDSTDEAGMQLWIENYCRAKPLESLTDAAMALTRELYPRRRQR